MSEPYLGHINRAQFEANLRGAADEARRKLGETATPEMAVQLRGSEAAIQFALFIADELNAGTLPEVLMNGGTRVLGNMVENFARGFTVDGNETLIGEIVERIIWQTSDDDDDACFVAHRPTDMGGRA